MARYEPNALPESLWKSMKEDERRAYRRANPPRQPSDYSEAPAPPPQPSWGNLFPGQGNSETSTPVPQSSQQNITLQEFPALGTAQPSGAQAGEAEILPSSDNKDPGPEEQLARFEALATTDAESVASVDTNKSSLDLNTSVGASIPTLGSGIRLDSLPQRKDSGTTEARQCSQVPLRTFIPGSLPGVV
ncbi:hypothetical protein Slin15195_G030040 [Septoria linicola]|uniref:Uncharacterized protein n=1 Tax=Septoria linicola TaxID=215465 RepID=A0A9Q9AIJ0_9PEZI|nr:hypothetical protein Slin14017_G029060 [Septoria linicola]USW49685.1 hypothetical protein Slin15195_G030040 [Septoria linicola]